jgi:hypothetical protein
MVKAATVIAVVFKKPRLLCLKSFMFFNYFFVTKIKFTNNGGKDNAFSISRNIFVCTSKTSVQVSFRYGRMSKTGITNIIS